jgi:hypothetical protein
MENKTYRNDKKFLSNHFQLVELRCDNKRLLLTPDLQGRVLTSSSDGEDGYSYGWINYNLISSELCLPHCNNFGGEDRFWLGPEGGQYSIFFEEGSDFEFDNWQVPSLIDLDKWDMTFWKAKKASFTESAVLKNWTGTTLSCRLDRSVELLDDLTVSNELGMAIPEGVDSIVFTSQNQLTNTGDFEWNESTGMLSIWILGQFIPSKKNTVIIPYKKSDQATINDRYFGKIDADRLKVTDSTILFKGDGEKRGKIGIPPKMTIPFAGAYDAENGTLTIVHFNFEKKDDVYVNSMWEHQNEPFKGDVINSYNDGPLEDGSIMGPFYEIETSSPAAHLKAGETITHNHTTMHFKGNFDSLNEIAIKVLGVDLNDTKI